MTMIPSDIHPVRWLVVGVAFALLCGLTAADPATAKILVPDGSQQTREGITVVLADGWEFADVQVHWFADEGLLAVERADGARRTFRPEDLAGLRDAAGRDVTRDVLPTWAVERLGGDLPPAAPAAPDTTPAPDTPDAPLAPDTPPVVEPPPPATEPGRRGLGDDDARARARAAVQPAIPG